MTILSALILSGVTVGLPMEADVRGTEITLADVATVTGDDAAEVQTVLDVSLGYAPAPGYSRLLTLAYLERAIAAGAPGVEVAFEGEASVRVRPVVERIEPETVLALAEAEVRRQVGDADAEVTAVDSLAAIQVPAGALPAELVVRPLGREVTPGTWSVAVEVRVDGNLWRTLWSRWDVTVWETVPVLARDVSAGEPLTVSLFERRRIEVRGRTARGVLDPMALLGSTAARDLPEGHLVVAGDVHRPVIVQVHDTLFVQVTRGSVTARVPARALEAGAVGDRIRLRTLTGDKELSAVVRTRDLAVIDLDAE